MSHPFFITEVFAEGPYAGNQLATVFNAQDLSAEEMQKIARAFNFAESTFVTGGDLASGFDVRIFTPQTELPFAGHPTLGTAYLLRKQCSPPPDSLVLNLGVGPIPVDFGADGVLWMQQRAPEFGEVLDKAQVAEDLSLELTDIESGFPVQYVSTGLEFALVPVNSFEALKRVRVKGDRLSHGVLVFCRGGYSPDQSIQARMFATQLGVSEDAATGSANGCLASYLVEHQYLGDSSVQVRVGQGYEINRPSQLYLDANKTDGEYSIRVGGKVGLVAEGKWLV